MFDDVIVPFLLTKTLGQVKGKTRFQKLMFFVTKSAEKEGCGGGLNFDFKTYLYGPFSDDLSREIDELVRRGYLNERVEHTCSNYEIYLYNLSGKGEDFLEAAAEKKTSIKEYSWRYQQGCR